MSHPPLILLRLRRPLASTKRIAPSDRAQVTQILAEEDGGTIAEARRSEEGWPSLELVDVATAPGKSPLYQLALWPFGSGALFEAGTTTVVADVVQHGLQPRSHIEGLEDALLTALARDGAALGMRESIDRSDSSTPRSGSPPRDERTLLVESLEARSSAGEELSMSDLRPLEKLVCETVFAKRGGAPLPPPRRDDLDPLATRAASLLLRHVPDALYGLGNVGLPTHAGRLAAFIGQSAGGPLDAALDLDGQRGSVIELAELACAEMVEATKVVAALAGLDPERSLAILTALLRGEPGYDLGWPGLSKMAIVGERRWVDNVSAFLSALTCALGERGVGAAREVLEHGEGPGLRIFAAAAYQAAGAQTAAPGALLDAVRQALRRTPTNLRALHGVIVGVVAKLPDASELIPDLVVFSYSPPAPGSVQLNEVALECVAAKPLPEGLLKLAWALARWDEVRRYRKSIGKPKSWGAPPKRLMEILRAAGPEGRAAAEHVVSELPEAAASLGPLLRKRTR